MGKRMDKVARAAHIKKNTHGTSNEISFSVLDAAKQSLDGGKKTSSGKGPSLGFIPIFTLSRSKKPPATPSKEQGILLPSGEFVSTEANTQIPLLPKPGASSAALTEGSSGPSASSPEPTATITSGKSSNTEGLTSYTQGAALSSSQASSSWVTPVDEVARRKATRKKRKAVAFSILAVLFALTVGIGCFVAYEALQEQKTTKGKLLTQLGTIAGTDEPMVALDEIVVEIINEGWVQGASGVSSDYWTLKAELEDSKAALSASLNAISQIQGDLQDPYDQEAAVQATVAAKARLSMIETGCALVETAIGGQNAYAHAEEAWVYLVEADTLAREAAQLASNTSVENIKQSITLTNEALSSLDEAEPHLEAAEKELEGLDYSSYYEYIRLRESSLNHALASDQAYLDRNKEKAAQENDQYNELDKQAAQTAQEIGSDTKDMVLALINPLIDESADAYVAQRGQASTADATLRDYLANKA